MFEWEDALAFGWLCISLAFFLGVIAWGIVDPSGCSDWYFGR